MSTNLFTTRRALNVFGSTLSMEELESGVASGRLPEFPKSSSGRKSKTWTLQEIPQVGSSIGFLRKPARPIAISVFVTKGGVLKSSVTLNLARMAALHNLRVCVVGLDMQGDISSAMGHNVGAEDAENLDDAFSRINSTRGLSDLFAGNAKLEDLILPTDLPTLSYIPETPELVALDQSLIYKNRREYWLREKVVTPLKQNFDLILLDCSPNWNRLITNALVACDVLMSPLECKINNFRNFNLFKTLVSEFKADLGADFVQTYIPTRLSPSRKLSMEIYNWYRANLDTCIEMAIRESAQGEEATAMHMSIPEYAPTTIAADEMRMALTEIWNYVLQASRNERASAALETQEMTTRGEDRGLIIG